MQIQPLIIIGAGPAGTAAAIQCRRLGVTPLLLDRSGRAGGLVRNAFCIENHPGLEAPLSGPDLALRLAANLSAAGVAVATAEVSCIKPVPEGFRVCCADRELLAGCVIVAAGTSACRLGLPGEEQLANRRVFYEVRDLLNVHPNPGRVVVLGSGEAACDYSLTLASAGAMVLLAVRGDRLKARGRLAELVQAQPSIHIVFRTDCAGLDTAGSFSVVLNDSVRGEASVYSADAVLAAVGRRSVVPGLIPGLVAGEAGCMPLAGLFLAGDCRRGTLGQAATAIGDGLEAAEAAVRFLER